MTHHRTHGMTGTPEYRAWKDMLGRCRNSRHRQYPNYGGRGIRVCDEWLHDFVAFYNHVGPRPSARHSIDRIDNDGNYEPGNVRWATRKMQNANMRTNCLLTYNGETLPCSVWACRMGIDNATLRHRLRVGWPLEKALMQRPSRFTTELLQSIPRRLAMGESGAAIARSLHISDATVSHIKTGKRLVI